MESITTQYKSSLWLSEAYWENYLSPESPQWLSFIRSAFLANSHDRFQRIAQYVEIKSGFNEICPLRQDDAFRALQCTPLEHTKVVILGQDPYPNQDHAMGLAFSVPATVRRLPPSLTNILHLAYVDAGAPNPPVKTYGDLTSWATQGVLLWNTKLTTQVREPGAHNKQGWEWVTEQVLEHIASKQQNVAFLLWGAHAKQYKSLIERFASTNGHLILQSTHPSPLSARYGFSTCHHFQRVNEWRRDTLHQLPIRWESPQIMQMCQRMFYGVRILSWWRRRTQSTCHSSLSQTSHIQSTSTDYNSTHVSDTNGQTTTTIKTLMPPPMMAGEKRNRPTHSSTS